MGFFYLEDRKYRLNKFAAAFPGRIDQIGTHEIEAWLNGLEVSGRTRNNYRNAVLQFFRYARGKRYLPRNEPTAVEDVASKDYPGLAQVVPGPGALGSVVGDLARCVDFVAFTGSTPVGQKLLASLGPLLRPSLMDLGGCDPLIVCDDANLERAANATVFGRFSNNGQICAAVKRVYVHAKVAEEYVAKVLAHVKAVKVGPYTDASTDVGPLANNRGTRFSASFCTTLWRKGRSSKRVVCRKRRTGHIGRRRF